MTSKILALACVFVWASAADARGAAPVLDDLLREAEENNPQLRAAAARTEAAGHVPSRTAASPDPEIGLTYLNDGLSQFTLGESEFAYLGLTWSQEHPYPGKLKRAEAVALADVGVAAAVQRRVRLDVRAGVVQAYAELYRIDQAAAILRETGVIVETLARSARSRYEVGAGIQESVLKAETEVLRLQAESARLEEDRAVGLARLAALLGRRGSMTLAGIDSLPEVRIPADAESVETEAAGSAAPMEASRAAVLRLESALAAARFASKPDLRWMAGYQYRGDLDPMVMGSIAFRLPVYRDRKQRQEVNETQAQLNAAQHDLAETEVTVRADARAAWARARRADRLVELYEKGVVVQARAAVASAQASYGVGRIEFLDLLNDLTVLLTARLEATNQAAERMQAAAALEALTGRTLIDAGPPAGGGEPS
jgi:cobalt-zinc-cadmium efflux system outer membrane protein